MAHTSRSLSITEGSQSKNLTGSMEEPACRLPLSQAHALLAQDRLPRNGANYSGPGSPASINNQDNPHRHVHRHLGDSSVDAFLSDGSPLCQVDNITRTGSVSITEVHKVKVLGVDVFSS